MRGAILPLPNTSSWCGAEISRGLFYLYPVFDVLFQYISRLITSEDEKGLLKGPRTKRVGSDTEMFII
jgi:hypothetical protein